MPVDLHTHTTASDGLLAPREVVAAALVAGLSVIAITDHDTVEGIAEALEATSGTTLQIIPGVELSVAGPDGSDAHLLGLLVDHASPVLADALAELRSSRLERARLMVERLRAAGHAVDLDEVLRQARGGAVGRVHLARALVDAGSAASVQEAFAELIGRRGAFYVHKSTLELAEAVHVIHEAGGVAVFAHPGVTGDAALGPLVAAGVDGIEAYHAEHTPAQREHYVALARKLGLIATGGSDFHGPGLKSGEIGTGGCPDSAVEALRERARLLHT